ncbi:MAG: D-alanyl-D-alanine carboxypeptidase/D-alanyl-D-alanine-endopeptidase [Thermodesulfobacteriota bacterium]
MRSVLYRCHGVMVSCLVALVCLWSPVAAQEPRDLNTLIGPTDSALIVRNSDGHILFSKNCDTLLVPASILKVITSLAAFHILGEEFRFTTEFYLKPNGDLVIRGYGDPCLVSEEIEEATLRIAEAVPRVGNILVDDSFFAPGIAIPGQTNGSRQPYDALNSALSANFNTVAVARQKGRYVSADPHTPLVPFAQRRIEKMAPVRGRTAFLQDPEEAALYAGELFACFLDRYGCVVTGRVIHGRADPVTDRLLYTHVSRDTLSDVVQKLLRYSSNFMANQILLACGAKMYGPPGDLAKGVAAVRHYVETVLAINGMQIDEGSGLSRENRLSARMMARVLETFAPYMERMRISGNEYYKTGTLSGVSTRAGYLVRDDGERYSFVVMLNTPGKRADAIMPVVRQMVAADPAPVGYPFY